LPPGFAALKLDLIEVNDIKIILFQ